jgi:hypothetical protein
MLRYSFFKLYKSISEEGYEEIRKLENPGEFLELLIFDLLQY